MDTHLSSERFRLPNNATLTSPETARAVRGYIHGLALQNSELVDIYVPGGVADEARMLAFRRNVFLELTTLARLAVRDHQTTLYYGPPGYECNELAAVRAGWTRMNPLITLEDDSMLPHCLKLTDDGRAAVDGLWGTLGLGNIDKERERQARHQWPLLSLAPSEQLIQIIKIA